MLHHFNRIVSNSRGIRLVGTYKQAVAGTNGDTTISLTSLANGLSSQPGSGDLIVVYFGAAGSSVLNEAPKDVSNNDYTQIATIAATDTYGTALAAYYLFAGAAETSLLWKNTTESGSNAGAIYVSVWRNVDPVTPMDVTRTTATGINSVLANPPSITPATSGAIIIAGGAGGHNSGVQTFSSSDLTGFESIGSDDTNDFTLGVGYHEWTSGAYDAAAFTFSASDNTNFSNAAITIALRPET